MGMLIPTVGGNAQSSIKLEVLDVMLEPVGQGKNVVHVKVRNPAQKEWIFAIDIQTKSPDYANLGWGDTFYESLPSGETRILRFAYKLHGPPTGNTWLRLRFHSLRSCDAYDYEKPDQVRTYRGEQLTWRDMGDGESIALSSDDAQTIIALFVEFQQLLRSERYQEAWSRLSSDHKRVGFVEEKNFLDAMRGEGSWYPYTWVSCDFLELRPETLNLRRDGIWTLTAGRGKHKWMIDFVRRNGTWFVDWIKGVPLALQWQNWQERLSGQMERHKTKHFEIYFESGSTAAREIETIAAMREKGYVEIAELIGFNKDEVVRVFLFEDQQSKWLATGHQGLGWAVGKTLVEIYSDDTKLDPYHELTHILMRHYGSPPAAFNEGFAVYVAERLGAKALKYLSGKGDETLDQRARQLLEEDDWIPLSDLLSYTEIGSKESRPRVAYPLAGSLVKYLIDQYGMEVFLDAYRILQCSANEAVGRENQERLSAICGRDLTAIENSWKEALLRE